MPALANLARLDGSRYRWWHELADIAAVSSDLANERRGDVGVLLGWGQKHRLEPGRQSTIHVEHLKFVFKVSDCPNAL